MCGTPVEVQLKDRACTSENVYMAIREIGIKFPDLVFTQTMLESANLKSRISIQNNNIFGMRLAKKRPTTAIGESGGYAVYADWYSCVLDYYEYQKFVIHEKAISEAKYLGILGKRYAENKHYVAVLKKNKKGFAPILATYDSVYNSTNVPQLVDNHDSKS